MANNNNDDDDFITLLYFMCYMKNNPKKYNGAKGGVHWMGSQSTAGQTTKRK